MNRDIFFKMVKDNPCPGRLNQDQVNGMNHIIGKWEKHPELTDLKWLAYILASVYHETDRKMQPIEEYGRGEGHDYGIPVEGKIYYGRGYIQITWIDNYKKLGDKIGVNLVSNPEKALEVGVALEILFKGMIEGLFRKDDFGPYSLGRFFREGEPSDWHNARRIVNGIVGAKGRVIAEDIAKYGRSFWYALKVAELDDQPVSFDPDGDIEFTEVMQEFGIPE